VIEQPDQLGDLACRQLMAFHNGLRLSLTALGLDPPKVQTSLKAYVGGKAA
jgi:hypothetical protein